MLHHAVYGDVEPRLELVHRLRERQLVRELNGRLGAAGP